MLMEQDFFKIKIKNLTMGAATYDWAYGRDTATTYFHFAFKILPVPEYAFYP